MDSKYAFLRRVTSVIVAGVLAVTTAVTMAGCGAQASAAEPLEKMTQLPASGIITKDQLKTLDGKTGTYAFTGRDGDITYSWLYDAAQVKNPTDQHLKVTFATSGSEVSSVKKVANKAPYAISAKIANFELAGSPKLKITVPQKWAANRVVVATEQKGSLKQISSAHPSIVTAGKKTTLTGTVTVTHKVLYFIAGLNKAGLSSDARNSGSNDGASSATSGDTDGDADGGAGTGASTGGDSGTDSAKDEAGSSTAQSPNGNANGTSSAANNGSSAAGSDSSGAAASRGSQSSGTGSAKKADSNSISVTVSIDAKTLVSHMSDVKASKRAYVPVGGWILSPTRITLKKGQTAYDALVAVTRSHHIQMESRWTPLYNAYYVTGIHQLYEFDGGSASGWMYSVDGWFPNYGSSSYSSLRDGSVIQWRYTRELGADVGGGWSGN